MPTDGNDATGNACIARNEQADWCGWNFSGLLSDVEVGDFVVGLDGRCLDVPTQTKVECQTRMNAVVIEEEEAAEPAVHVGDIGGVLLHCVGQAHDEVGEGVAGARGSGGSEGEDAEVIEQRFLNVLVEGEIATEADGVIAVGPEDGVAYLVEVGACTRS